MITASLRERLEAFCSETKCTGKGCLSVMLQMTRMAKETGLPLDVSSLTTDRGGQVKGLSGSNLRQILSDHGITRVLTKEGGRTSRGSIENASTYVAFLNEFGAAGIAELDAIESFWADKVRAYFDSEPLVFRHERSKSLSANIADLIAQVRLREKKDPGATYLGAVLEHLVGAKLEIALGAEIIHHVSSDADASSGRAGDFAIGDVVIHVTTAPLQPLLEKCLANLTRNLVPVIVTLADQVAGAQSLARALEIDQRIEVWPAEQFLAANMYEFSHFDPMNRVAKLEDLCARYNRILEEFESSPALRIELE